MKPHTIQLSSSHKFKDVSIAFITYEIKFDQDGTPLDFCVSNVNQQFLKLYHLKEKQLLGKSIRNIFKDQAEDWETLFKTIVSTNSPSRFEYYSDRIDKYLDVIICAPEKNQLQVIITDITYEKTLKDELIESKTMLSEMGKMANVGGWEHDLIERKVVWTDSLFDVVNLSHDEEPPGIEEHYQYYEGEYENLVRQSYEKAIHEQIPFNIEVIFRDAKGHKKWANIYGEPVVENGRVAKIRGYLQDITDYKNAELKLRQTKKKLEKINQSFLNINEALSASNIRISNLNEKLMDATKAARKNEVLYRTIFDTSKDAIFIYSSFEKLDYANPAACKFCHKSMEELLATSPRDFIPNDCWTSMLSIFQSIEHGEQIFLEKSFPDAEGNQVHMELYGCPIVINEKTHYYTSLKDISHQRQHENEIKHKNKFIANILELNPNLVYIFDLDESKTVYANKATRHCFGYDAKEEFDFYNDVVKGLVHPDDREKFMDHLENLNKVKDGEVIPLEFRLRNERGDYFWLFAKETVFERNSDGSVNLIIGTATDVTETKLIEEQLALRNREIIAQNEGYIALNEELEESNLLLTKVNTELDSFVYRVSHDLRAPIASSLGLANLSLKEATTDHMRQYSQLQINSLKRLDTYIKDILNYSRNARLELQLEEVNLEEVINELVEMLISHDPNHKKIDFQQTIPENFPIYTDKLRLKIILNNLLSNSFKYYNKEQESPYIRLEVKPEEDKIHFSISDNGIGIGSEHIKQVFKMFYRATNNGSGSGIGLYIVKDCVSKLNGEISLTSNAGEGTVFDFWIPLQAPPVK